MLINPPSVYFLKKIEISNHFTLKFHFLLKGKKGNYATSYICLEGTKQLIKRMNSKWKRKI